MRYRNQKESYNYSFGTRFFYDTTKELHQTMSACSFAVQLFQFLTRVFIFCVIASVPAASRGP